MSKLNDKIEALFQAAVALDTKAQRADYLSQACPVPELRREVESLLAAHDQPDALLATQPEPPRPTIKLDPADAKDEAVGSTIGRYKLLERRGEGGCGVVYVAEQTEPVRRRVALKIIKLGMDTKQVVARFEAERQALALMDHPNIARVFDAGTTDTGRPYFVMELVRGIKITDYCDENTLSTKARLDLFLQVCQAIQHAHQKGIIHRDIKPSNVLVADHDGVAVPKIIDFGIAKATTDQRLTDKTLFTAFEQFIGTPAYMSPEQAKLSGLDIDTRSDIYSLGVLLYELLTGKTPFEAERLLEGGLDEIRRIIREEEPMRPSTKLHTLDVGEQTTLAKHRQSEPPKLAHLISGDLDWIVMKCLEKDRTRRYETANDLAHDIERHLNNEPVVARPPSAAYRLQKLVRRNKLAFVAAGGIVAALAIGLGVSTWLFLKEKEARQRAIAAERAQSQLRQKAEEQSTIAEQRRGEAQQAREGEAGERRKAEEQRRLAEEQRSVAELNAHRASENETQTRRALYAADINLAQQALQVGSLGRARRLLDRHRVPLGVQGSGDLSGVMAATKPNEDLRGWEWRYLWQQCQGDALALLTQRPERAFSVSFSHDGGRLAVGFWTGRAELWDLANRRLLKVLYEEVHGVPAVVAFSPRRDLLASTAAPGVVTLHDFTAGRETVLWKSPAVVRDLAFSDDGGLLGVLTIGRAASPIVVIDTGQATVVSSNTVSGGGIHFDNVRISPDHTKLYVSYGALDQPTVRCVRMRDWQLIWERSYAECDGFSAMALSPDGQVLVTGTGYGDERSSINVWDAQTGRDLGKLEGHTAWVGQLAFSRDGRFLASASADQTIRLWDCATWRERGVLRGHGDSVQAVAFAPDGHTLASGGKEGAVMVWDAGKPSMPRQTQELPAHVLWALPLPGGQAMLAVSTNSGFSLIDVASLVETPLPFPPGAKLCLAPPDILADYGQTNVLRVYRVLPSGHRLLAELPLSGSFQPGRLAFCPERRLLAWSERPSILKLASLDEPSKQIALSSGVGGLTPAKFGGGGRFLLAYGRQDRLVVWDLPADQPVVELAHSSYLRRPGWAGIANQGDTLVTATVGAAQWDIVVQNLSNLDSPSFHFKEVDGLSGQAFSPDKGMIAVSSQAGMVILYDLERKERRVIHGHRMAVHGVSFSPDGRRLTTSCAGRETVKLWDVATGLELLAFSGKHRLLTEVGFTDDGNTILVGSLGVPGSFQYWRAPSWAEIQEAERSGKSWRPSLDPGTSAIESQAPDAQSLAQRGSLRAQQGRWKEAAADYARAVDADPANLLNWQSLAALLVLADNVPDYQKSCQAMLARFGSTSHPRIARIAAKVCLLLPVTGDLLESASRLAQTSLSAGADDPLSAWSLFTKGLAEYRQGRFASAKEWMQQALGGADANVQRDAAAYLVMAMASHQLMQPKETDSTMSKGIEILEKKLPHLDSGDLGQQWCDLLIAHILMREAKTLIESQPATGTKSQPQERP